MEGLCLSESKENSPFSDQSIAAFLLTRINRDRAFRTDSHSPPASLTDAEVKMLIVGSVIVIRCPGEGDQFSPFHKLTILDKYFTQVVIIGVEMLPMFEDHLITITDVFSDKEDFSIGDRDDGCTAADIVINSWVETIRGNVPPAFFDGKGTVRCA